MAKLTDAAFKRFASLDAFPQPPVIRIAHPVVLMHGFGLLSVLVKGGHLHDEAMYLRLRGVTAYAPNVSPYQTVPIRAEMWRDRLDQILAETGADKVHLIAHSMGGLDARWLISQLDYARHVLSLTTIATPHQGSALANIVLERPERLQGWISEAANWAGERVLDGGKADFRRAVHDLTPEYVQETFNPEVPDHPDVVYRSWAGRAGKGTDTSINPVLRPLNLMLYAREGVNDGFVSVESAKWGTFMGELDADHAQQIGIDLLASSTYTSTAFFAEIVAGLEM
ncbi:MAG: alpha/beta fold hydrolase [Rhodothermales bacterium]